MKIDLEIYKNLLEVIWNEMLADESRKYLQDWKRNMFIYFLLKSLIYFPISLVYKEPTQCEPRY